MDTQELFAYLLSLLLASLLLPSSAAAFTQSTDPQGINDYSQLTSRQLLTEIDQLTNNLLSQDYSESKESSYQQTRSEIELLFELALQQALAEEAYPALLDIAEQSGFWNRSAGIEAARAAIDLASNPSEVLGARMQLAKLLHRTAVILSTVTDPDALEEASQLTAELLKDHSTNPEVLKLHAEILRDAGQVTESYEFQKKALNIARSTGADTTPYLQILFFTAARHGMNEDALKWFDQFEDFGNSPATIYATRAQILEEMEQHSDAANAFLEAAQRDNNWWNYWCDAGRNFFLSSSYDAALATLRECLDQSTLEEDFDNSVPKAHFYISSMLHERGVYEESTKHAEAAIEMAPDIPGPYYYLSLNLQILGNYPEAIDAIKDAIRLSDGRHAGMHFQLGSIYFDQRQWRLSRLSYEKAAELNPADAAAPYNVALCFSREGYYRDAAKWYQEVLDRDPKHPERESILERIRSFTD